MENHWNCTYSEVPFGGNLANEICDGNVDFFDQYKLYQGFSNFFPGDPNFSIKIVRDPKQIYFFNLPKLV